MFIVIIRIVTASRQLKYHVEQLEKAGGHAAPADEKVGACLNVCISNDAACTEDSVAIFLSQMFTQNSAMVPRPPASPLLSVQVPLHYYVASVVAYSSTLVIIWLVYLYLQELNRAQLAVDSIIKELHKRLDVLRALFQSSLGKSSHL